MLFAPFLFFYAIILFAILAFLFILLEIHIINFAFQAIGLPPQLAFFALFLSLLGSWVNIPVMRLGGIELHPAKTISTFGISYRPPHHLSPGSTTVAINVGGAIVPIAISIYVLARSPSALFPSIIGAAIVALIVNRFARPVRGLGIAVPMFIPPIVAALAGYFLGSNLGSPGGRDVVAYVSGVIGTLIGADLANLGNLRALGSPVASIGGAGTFDGIFLTGIVAVLLA
jgi:uncharacterized membrane protein